MHSALRRAVIGLAAALLVLAAIRFGTHDASLIVAPAASASIAATSAPARFGPGTFPATSTTMPIADDTQVPPGLAVDADGHLVINKALHDVLDYFLLGGLPGERAQHVAALHTYLRQTLGSPAREEAERIVDKYLTYLVEHDKLLERIAPPRLPADSVMPAVDADRIAAWIAQRSRLRQSILGADVARVWYADEEAAQLERLGELRDRVRSPAIDADRVQQTLTGVTALRRRGASASEQRTLIASRFGEAAAQRFDTLEREEQAWQQRYAVYQQEAERIRAHTGLAEDDRAKQVDALRMRTFPSEPERLRAQALDAQPRAQTPH